MTGLDPVRYLTLILLTGRIGLAANNAGNQQRGLNSAFKSFNAELNPICHVLALLGAHNILHVSRIRVKGLSDWQKEVCQSCR